MAQVKVSKVASSSVLKGKSPHQQTRIARKAKLLDQMCRALRSRHYSRWSERIYCQWLTEEWETIKIHPER
ncbi:MAG: hypothetical protein RQ760_16455, partial [Sedimentisphaerales bacterium]|nr:hypothetical protein [Sedimentisphaerales bacterium]